MSVKPPLKASVEELSRMLDVIENEILPLTKKSVEEIGNKVFGAAVLEGSTLKTLCAGTNHEIECPLYHGEVFVIDQWAKSTDPGRRGEIASNSIFLSTHEPCCMCISSIVWAGFEKVFYLFSYDTTAEQGIPHDLDIMHELWGVQSYQRCNKFCSTACIIDLINSVSNSTMRKELEQTVQRLTDIYAKISEKYHKNKNINQQNSLPFS